jgi:hypothetical protein
MKGISTSFQSLASKARAVAALLFFTFIVPALSIAQGPPSSSGGGDPGGGGLPTLPFDDKLNYILIALAIVFAVVIYKRYQRKLAK